MKAILHGVINDGGSTAINACEIVELEEIILKHKINLIHVMKQAEQYIQTVPDSCIRTLLTLHFIEFKTWGEIYELLENSDRESTVDKLKKRFYRYCAENKIKPHRWL